MKYLNASQCCLCECHIAKRIIHAHFFAIYFNRHNSIFGNELIVEELQVMYCKKNSQYQQKISNSKFSDWLINKVGTGFEFIGILMIFKIKRLLSLILRPGPENYDFALKKNWFGLHVLKLFMLN